MHVQTISMGLVELLLLLNCVMVLIHADTYADRVCDLGVDLIALDGDEKTKFLVTFQCDGKRIKDCLPEGTVTGETSNKNDKIFETEDKKKHVITCHETDKPTIIEYYAYGICHLPQPVADVGIDGDSAKMTNIKFDCTDDKIRFKRCKPNDKDEWVEVGRTVVVGEPGKKFKFNCLLASPPRISFDFVPSACSAKARAMPIAVLGPQTQMKEKKESIQVKFDCNSDQTQILKCYPEGGAAEGVLAGKDGHFGGHGGAKYHVDCQQDGEPIITANDFVTTLCNSKDKVVPIASNDNTKIRFECNDPKTRITTCKADGGAVDGIPAGAYDNFGGEFHAKYHMKCLADSAPAITTNSFAVETCLGVTPDVLQAELSAYIKSKPKKSAGSKVPLFSMPEFKIFSKTSKTSTTVATTTFSRLVETSEV